MQSPDSGNAQQRPWLLEDRIVCPKRFFGLKTFYNCANFEKLLKSSQLRKLALIWSLHILTLRYWAGRDLLTYSLWLVLLYWFRPRITWISKARLSQFPSVWWFDVSYTVTQTDAKTLTAWPRVTSIKAVQCSAVQWVRWSHMSHAEPAWTVIPSVGKMQ